MAWSRLLAAYKQPRLSRSLFELTVTLAGFMACWTLVWLAFDRGFWGAALPLSVVAAGFLVRLFMMQHDCGHGAFFRSRTANDWVGRLLSVLTLTPYDYWRRTHAVHHATSGDLDRRGVGAVATLTVEEYRALSPLKRFGYRLYRHPLVLFGVGPVFVFFVQHRAPVDLMRSWRAWASTLGCSATTASVLGLLAWALGPVAVMAAFGLVSLLAATIGVWLFYVQHQFEGVTWVRSTGWKAASASLGGSSHYELPRVLRWFTANIGVHHVHHLSSAIPFYRLQAVLRDHPELAAMNRVTLRDSIRCARLALWDEAGGRMVSLAAARA